MKKWFLLMVSLILVSTGGCGSGNMFEGQEGKLTAEAKKFATSAALDSGDYASILSDPSNANPTDYAAAAMGAAGLDPVKLIQTLNDVASGTNKTDLSAVVSSIKIDTSALDELKTAKDKLKEALVTDPDNSDLKLQIALTSLTSTLTAVAQVGENLGVANLDLSDGISETEAAAIGTKIGSIPTADLATSLLVNTTGTGNTTLLTDVVSDDVSNIVNNLDALPSGSELRTVLNDSMQGTDGLNKDGSKDTKGNPTISATEISSYYSNILGK
ncbi:MAG: hypothetical protein A3I04_02605 [Nitrospinae bacterium RIFCSPLOWO2_02_FULL_39_110]|nr:MAG: hypothetical protein A2W53_00435 [Nitrospinae bacterium RIFCSPHIGHO2_02_39_11]OGV98302.1 MAG: hypothetical protein A3D97_04980 [Nitrospinae bacterium RIFCSPHIGHO2_12_FULL_39_42]OGW02275.1 MAG: hypothetical protein A2Z59_03510 [Nitrospinae bacterium RIFCSPLOWO2_02_39_17]OGW05938.1 MAG: hypothetical protein A3I04_02605 [Nitrospinae bacterium RIFCSPLOWO2_02_FULL_39_110]OGW08981.1 MAG: hypothetical protein A2W75_00725 [Nitrospinae bacterium RIFCSPLOWO2_12_39_15]OGW11479.1 MAG: hypothetical